MLKSAYYLLNNILSSAIDLLDLGVLFKGIVRFLAFLLRYGGDFKDTHEKSYYFLVRSKQEYASLIGFLFVIPIFVDLKEFLHFTASPLSYILQLQIASEKNTFC